MQQKLFAENLDRKLNSNCIQNCIGIPTMRIHDIKLYEEYIDEMDISSGVQIDSMLTSAHFTVL